jgi:hypothetical protein
MSIENELRDMNGVSSVAGDADKKEVTVAWDSPATLDGIKATLKEINYPATE